MTRKDSTPDPAARGSASGSKPGRGSRSLAVRFVQNVLLATFSIVVTLAVLEIALRIRHGELTTRSSQLRPPPNRAANPAATYDADLGWVPRVGPFERSAGETWTITDAGLRSNGTTFSSSSRPIVVTGDSFTFGDEVLDHETWPAQLEGLMQVPVLNGGVFAYGVDQAFLRASQLLDAYRPEFVLLAFIGDDINRGEFSFYSGWKPWFEQHDGELALRNVPVPRDSAPTPRFATVRSILGYSFLCNAVLGRLAPQWWSPAAIVRAHTDGERIAVELFLRLQAQAQLLDARLVVIALSTSGQIGGNARTRRVVEHARQRGIDVLDLLPEVELLPADSQALMFRPRGHYTPVMNARVAARVAAHLNELRSRP